MSEWKPFTAEDFPIDIGGYQTESQMLSKAVAKTAMSRARPLLDNNTRLRECLFQVQEAAKQIGAERDELRAEVERLRAREKIWDACVAEHKAFYSELVALRRELDEAPWVYCEPRSGLAPEWHEQPGLRDTHRAKLVRIEKIEPDHDRFEPGSCP